MLGWVPYAEEPKPPLKILTPKPAQTSRPPAGLVLPVWQPTPSAHTLSRVANDPGAVAENTLTPVPQKPLTVMSFKTVSWDSTDTMGLNVLYAPSGNA